MTWLLLAGVLVAVDAPVLWAARRRPQVTRWHGIETRWLRVTWRAGLLRGEWWVGARASLAQDALLLCPMPGVCVAIAAESRGRRRQRPDDRGAYAPGPDDRGDLLAASVREVTAGMTQAGIEAAIQCSVPRGHYERTGRGDRRMCRGQRME